MWFQQLLLSSLSSLTFFHIPLFFFYDVGRLTFFNSLVSFTSWLHWLWVPVLMSGGSVCSCLLLQDYKNESWKRFFTSRRYETESELGFGFPMSKKTVFGSQPHRWCRRRQFHNVIFGPAPKTLLTFALFFCLCRSLFGFESFFSPPRMIFKNEQTTFCSHDRVLPHLSWLASSTPPLGLLRPAARFSSTCRLMRAKWIFDSLFDCSHSLRKAELFPFCLSD